MGNGWRGIILLQTPIGPIKLYVNNEEMKYTAIKIDVDKRCLDVNGRYLNSI